MAIDRAATLRNAENLVRQGKLELAAAEYVRVIEDQPRDWNTANTLGDLYVRIGQNDKAVDQFTRIADQLSTQGFFQKASALYKKILKLKPDHERTLLQMAEVAASLGLLADARTYLTTVMDRRMKSRDKRGVAELRVRLGLLDPADFDGRLMAARARVELGDIPAAVRDLKKIAGDLAEKGREDEASTLLDEAAGLDPNDPELRARLARGAVARGDLATAAEFLTAEIAGDDPELQLVVAGIRLRGDAPDEGLAILGRLLEQHPERLEQVRGLGLTVAEQAPEPGFGVVQLVLDRMIAAGDLAPAATLLQEYVILVPQHIPALLRLVDVSVDAGLESAMYGAQAQLADAYLAEGLAAEALFIAEDLMAREPWDTANVERLRSALELAGEPDPAGLIAERLSGRSPFMATDLSGDAADFPPFGAMDDEAPAETIAPEPDPAPAGEPAAPAASRAATAHAEAETVEVDLSIVLDAGEAPSDEPAASWAESADLDGVFEHLRSEATRRSAVEGAEERYRHALDLRAAGDLDGAAAALEEASRVPTLRFAAAALLGRILRDRGMMAEAVEWFERAAEAPAENPGEMHELLYDLADALERQGETARALALNLELQAEAGAYRDVEARIDRLSKVQTRG